MLFRSQQLPNSRDLQGNFEAFKFSDTSVVRFQVNVQFCVDECNPVDCDGITSYGRRKRDVAAVATLAPRTTTVPEPYASRLVYDPTLGQNVLTVDTPLSKEIIVEPGTKVDSYRDPRADPTFNQGGVFIQAGSYGEEDVVCTTLPVVVATGAAVVFLQLCILVTCILCIYTAKRSTKTDRQVDHQSLHSGRSSVTPHPPHTLYHDNLTFRPPMSSRGKAMSPRTFMA